MEITLRKLKEEDAPQLASLANNRNIWDYLRNQMPHPFSLEDAQRFIASGEDMKNRYVFAIESENQLTGMIGLHPQQDIYQRSLELGYWIGEPYWGRGLATAAVRKILDFGFALEGINRIFAGAFENNPASRKVLEKNGFVFEGIARKAAWKNDRLLDEWRYGILRSEHSPICKE